MYEDSGIGGDQGTDSGGHLKKTTELKIHHMSLVES